MDRSLALGRRAGAEAIAAFALVFAGCGAIVADARYDGALGSVGIAIVFGLIIMVMVYATGHLSGAHINPAVTIAFTLTRHFPARDALGYVGAQIVGASAGALAPALVAGELRDLWIYLVGPIAGAALGAFAYQLVRGGEPHNH
jgi:glycerol uptake facilitator-like aquaporin